MWPNCVRAHLLTTSLHSHHDTMTRPPVVKPPQAEIHRTCTTCTFRLGGWAVGGWASGHASAFSNPEKCDEWSFEALTAAWGCAFFSARNLCWRLMRNVCTSHPKFMLEVLWCGKHGNLSTALARGLQTNETIAAKHKTPGGPPPRTPHSHTHTVKGPKLSNTEYSLAFVALGAWVHVLRLGISVICDAACEATRGTVSFICIDRSQSARDTTGIAKQTCRLRCPPPPGC
jgi:hypothetical protein